MDDFVEQLEIIKAMRGNEMIKQLRDALIANANANIKKDKLLKEKADELAVKDLQLREAQDICKQKFELQQQIQQRLTNRAMLLPILNQKLQEIDEETEQMEDNFLMEEVVNDDSIAAFKKMYMEKRSLYYVRKLKKENMRNL